MSALELIRSSPGLLATALLAIIATVVLGALSLGMSRGGMSVRPILFLACLFALVILPQLAYHAGVATERIPARDLTWIPERDRAGVFGWVENDAALTIRDDDFADPAAPFAADVDASLTTNLKLAGALAPFSTADAARMAIVGGDGTIIVARFKDVAAATEGAQAYATQAIGLWPKIGSDGTRTATRPAGDIVKLVVAGRTVVVATGADEATAGQHLRALRAISPGKPVVTEAARRYWLYQPGVLPAIIFLLVLVYVAVFFRGSSWAAAVAPDPNVTRALGAAELAERVIAIDRSDTPFAVTRESDGSITVAWRFADARWLDLARAHRLRAEHRLRLTFDEATRTVSVTEQQTRFSGDGGAGRLNLSWSQSWGITLFEVQHGRVFGLQFDEHGRPLPKLDYAYRFDVREMKAPLIDIVTRNGWTWRPTAWMAPTWLRWLTG
jgi:hypothetical protein